MTFVREFLEKKVQYLIFGYGGKEKWFPDVAVCQKQICYGFEDNLYSFNIPDFENSVVKLTSITPVNP